MPKPIIVDAISKSRKLVDTYPIEPKPARVDCILPEEMYCAVPNPMIDEVREALLT